MYTITHQRSEVFAVFQESKVLRRSDHAPVHHVWEVKMNHFKLYSRGTKCSLRRYYVYTKLDFRASFAMNEPVCSEFLLFSNKCGIIL